MKDFNQDSIGKIIVIQQIRNAYLLKREASFRIEDRHQTSYSTFADMVDAIAYILGNKDPGEKFAIITRNQLDQAYFDIFGDDPDIDNKNALAYRLGLE